ncbi:PAS/PAC sensor signal transduction histidine kinase [Solidesulfovibrio fructosivorans JJ]]|uniref:histidine kinase n=1 Tax=Solidesulfovibrio fructosivorans JJ] TaxID=596151 RepID=E1K035_SOLFR|nr:PAS domain S-box protein [Solidesulfovibrio fructosivorans]EFL50041.1 PAS/PAC sensor signal transduction histidine kinase [Solidesulfovibrio fructosivorans JJ]]
MGNGLTQRFRLLVLSLALAAVLVLPAAWVLWRSENARLVEETRANALAHLGDARLSLQSALTARLTLLRAIAAYAASHPDLTDEQFGDFAAGLMDGVSDIRSLQLARDAVVSHVFPRTSNAGILGLSLRRDLPPSQREALSRTLENGRTAIDGPEKLLQGGCGIIARTPVFLLGGPRLPGRMWGVATITIDADAFFHDVAVQRGDDIRLAIRLAGNGAMVYGDQAIFADNPVTVEMAVPGGMWRLAAVPEGGWKPLRPLMPLLVGAGAVWLALWGAFFGFLSWPARLARAVGVATAALDAAKTGLERTVAARTSELVAANEALRRGESRYRAFIDATSDMAFLKDAELRHLVINNKLAEFMGKASGDAIGRTDFELMPPELAARCHESDVAARDGRDIVTMIETLGDRTFEVRKFPVPLGEGKMGVGGYIRDIGDRLRAEQALRQSEEVLRNLYENAPVGIFTSTPDGRYVKVNGYLARMYGYPDPEAMLAEVANIRDQVYFDPDERDSMLDTLKKRDHLSNYEVRRLTRTGNLIWVSLNIRAVCDKSGAIAHLEGFCTDITQRKQAETVLADQERQLRVIFDNSPLGQVFFDATGTVVSCNKRHLEIMGITSDNIIGVNLVALLPILFKEALVRALAGELSRAEGPYSSVLGGRNLYLRAIFSPVETGTAPTPVIASIENITEERKKDATLRLLWAAVEQSPASIAITDLQGTIEYVNPHFSTLTGYTPDEAKGKNPRILKSGVHPEAFYRDLWDTLLAGRVWRGELCNRKKNGELYWEASSISPVRDEQGEISHFVAVKEDITRQRESKERLRQLMGEFEAIFNASSVGIVHLGPDDTVVRVNRRFAELFGIPAEELAGKGLAGVHESIPRLRAFRREQLALVAAGKEVHFEERFHDRGGHSFWCSVDGRRIDVANPASGSIWTFDDISARKELERVREDVERIMRHDLKAPLNSIVNLPEIVAVVGPVTDDQRELLSEIEQSGHAMLEQIELSLDLYKMETGTYVLQAQRIDLARIVAGVVSMLEPTAKAKGVDVTLRSPEELFITGSALLCQTIAANLVKNAIEAETSGHAVTVSLAEKDGRALLTVQNPTPVPPELIPVFFEKYATSGKNGGSGLGTYSARLMTRSQRGEISMESTPDAGTIVTVSLPVT